MVIKKLHSASILDLFPAIFDTTSEGIVVQNADGEIVQFNKRALEILALTEDQLLGRTSHDPNWKPCKEDGSDFPGNEHPSMIALKTGQPVRKTVMGLGLPTGEQRWIEINSTPINSLNQIFAVTTFLDVSESKLRKSHLTQNAKLMFLGEISSGIAHEINNPLAVIIGNLSILSRFFNDPEKLSAKVKTMEKACQNILKIVNGLRRFAKGSSGSPQVPTSINSIIEDSLSLIDPKLKKTKIQVSKSLESTSLILCDSIEIEQAVIDLLNNSIFAVREQETPWIRIETIDEAHSVKLRIHDSGSGIPIEKEELIFQPFFTTKAQGDGAGLGLSIVLGILSKHKAQIQINRKVQNTCFEISFPKLETKTQAA